MECSSSEGLLRDSDKRGESEGALAEYLAKRALESAPAFLNALLAPEKRFDAKPRLSIEDETGKNGSHRIGSDEIKIGKGDPYRTAVHEYFHLYQSKSGFAQLALRYLYYGGTQGSEDSESDFRQKLGHAILEAGAYFFEAAMVAQGSLRSQRSEESTINALSSVRSACDFSYNLALVTSIRTMLKVNQPQMMVEEVERLAENHDPREAHCASELQVTSAALGKGMAMLVFAANDFEAKPTLAVLDSDPRVVLYCIRAMDEDRIRAIDWMLRGREQRIEAMKEEQARMLAEDFAAAFADRKLPEGVAASLSKTAAKFNVLPAQKTKSF